MSPRRSTCRRPRRPSSICHFRLTGGVSPDRRHAPAATTCGSTTSARQTSTRFTFGGNNATPVWSRDGRTVYYSPIDTTGRKSTVSRKPVDGSRQAETRLQHRRANLSQAGRRSSAASCSSTSFDSCQQADIARIAFGRRQAPATLLVSTTFDETGGSLSPDGRWVGLCVGRDRAIRDLRARCTGATAGGRWQVSNSGGEEPRWSPTGANSIFRSDARFMAADGVAAASFEASTPTMMFDGVLRDAQRLGGDLQRRRDRTIPDAPAGEDRRRQSIVRVLLNWGSSQTGCVRSARYNPASR